MSNTQLRFGGIATLTSVALELYQQSDEYNHVSRELKEVKKIGDASFVDSACWTLRWP